MNNVRKVQFRPVVSRSMLDCAVSEALCKFVGRGKRFTSVKHLSRASGVNVRMLEAAKNPDSTDYRPLNRENLFSVMLVAGADFTNELLPQLAHQGAFDLPPQVLPSPGELCAESAEDHLVIAVAAKDGRFCAQDHGKLWRVGQDFIERGMQLVGMGKRRRVAA
jgi:hypothetical protein